MIDERRRLRPSEVTPSMANWALTVLHSSAQLGDIVGPLPFDTMMILAQVEIHGNGTAENPAPHPHRGVGLFHADSGAPVVVPTHPTLPEGIDVNEQATDYTQVMASGRSFVYIKATEGVTWTSGMLERHSEDAEAVGFKRGAYHYFRARDGIEQIDHFLSTIDGYTWELPPVLDVEELDGQLPYVLVDHLADCLDHAGENVGLYTMPGFWNTLPLDSIFAVRTAPWLWVATWGPKPLACNKLGAPKIWQYSASAAVPGFPGHADVNRVLDAEWWASLT